jgi:hypothetical protein
MASPRRTRAIAAVLLGAAVASCSSVSPWLAARMPPPESLAAISAVELHRHVTTLASTSFQGRAPGTRGEELTVDYLVSEFRRAGARPGNPDGTFVQEVPLIGIASHPEAAFCVGARCTAWKYNEDYVGGSLFLQPEIDVQNSEVVFVGYGLVAPEEGRDDYKDVDVRGKTVLMLATDPGPMDVPGEVRPESTRSGGSYAARALASRASARRRWRRARRRASSSTRRTTRSDRSARTRGAPKSWTSRAARCSTCR